VYIRKLHGSERRTVNVGVPSMFPGEDHGLCDVRHITDALTQTQKDTDTHTDKETERQRERE